MSSGEKAAKLTRCYVIFEKDVDGKPMVFYNNGRKNSLPHVDVPEYVTDPMEPIRSHFSKEYGLSPEAITKVHEPMFSKWDGDSKSWMNYKFFRVTEFTGDFPPNAKFKPSEEVYKCMKKIELGGEEEPIKQGELFDE